ncbi:MAG: alpha-galactosidase [Firmicutes bacterium]|nr:alpha-galactosidase [Bacillota bacterium]
MAIDVDEQQRYFHLTAGESSYVFQVIEEGYLAHWYWGPAIRPVGQVDRREMLIPRPFAPSVVPDHEWLSMDTLPQEFPGWGRGDYREPALRVRDSKGNRIVDLRFAGYEVMQGWPGPEGLPHLIAPSDGECQTLAVRLNDPVIRLDAILYYSVAHNLNAVIRWVRLENRGSDRVTLERALSASVDLPYGAWQFVQLTGHWGRERHVESGLLRGGVHRVESVRGTSSHQAQPFLAIAEEGVSETFGAVRAMNLVYSGNFLAIAQGDSYGGVRLGIGIHDDTFEWVLEPGEFFETPQAVLVYADHGLQQMSHVFHELYRKSLGSHGWRGRNRPIVLNSWEAMYFRVNHQDVVQLAKVAADVGIEVVVIDDGWFGDRRDDRRSLGDWVSNPEKFPRGIKGVADDLHALGLKCGLWVEPEMVSRESRLYQEHPEWCLGIPDRSLSEGRHQLVLDLSNPQVVDWMVEWLGRLIEETGIDYVKWDMNRHLSEVGSPVWPPSRQGEVYHRYVLGLYRVLEALTGRYPEVLFEGCSGGGGRFDPGMLYYTPQIWTSDNSDAIDRLAIQYGTSLLYPVETMTAHVSAVPNHQVGRVTPLSTRGWVAFSANLGYELDLRKLSRQELDEIRQQIRFYRQMRDLVQHGTFYRLASPWRDNSAGWMFVASGAQEALVIWINQWAEVSGPIRWLRLRGLDPTQDYRVVDVTQFDFGRELGIWGGDRLMGQGLAWRFDRDFQAKAWYLRTREFHEGERQ